MIIGGAAEQAKTGKGNSVIHYFNSGIPCGFASPANDYPHDSISINDLLDTDPDTTYIATDEGKCRLIDVNDLLITNPDATFIIRAQGRSMEGSGIFDGNYLVIDRSKGYYPGCAALCYFNNQFTIKHVYMEGGQTRLVSANPDFQDIILGAGDELILWGIVAWSLNKIGG
jgi:DNA polymerase V